MLCITKGPVTAPVNRRERESKQSRELVLYLHLLIESVVPQMLHVVPVANYSVLDLYYSAILSEHQLAGDGRSLDLTGYLMSSDCRTAAASSPHIISFNSIVSDIA